MQAMENSTQYTTVDNNPFRYVANYIENSPTSIVAREADEALSAAFGATAPATTSVVVYGIEDRGIWKQAHQITHGYGLDRFEDITPQDAFNDIVVALMELTVENPDIIEEGPAYMLVAAANRVRNLYAKKYHRYLVKKYGMTTSSLDKIQSDIEDDKSNDYTENIAQIAFTYDYETAVTVRSIVAGLDAESRTVAGYLYDGYKASEIARLTGMYPMQVSRIVKGLRTQLEGALL